MIDYTIYYKHPLPVGEPWGPHEDWDLFISAYTPAERIACVFSKARARHKRWLVFSEYGYDSNAHPPGDVFDHPAVDEADFIAAFWDTLPPARGNFRICVDITGFVRPYLIYLVRWLQEKGITT